jgi:hypothetical protein
MKYRKKIEVDLIVWDGEESTLDEIKKIGSVFQYEHSLHIITSDGGFLNVKIGDHLVNGVDGLFSCRKEYFEKSYEKIED